MGTAKTNPKWCVFDTIKKFPQTPEALMAEINSAISSLEYTHSTALLKTPPFHPTHLKIKTHFDAKMADEAYKEGLASLASGKLDEAIHSLNTSLLKCPPNQTSAVAKLQSLIAVTSKQLKSNPNN